MVFPFASCSHIPLEAYEKLMEAFLQRKEMVRSRQDKYTKMAHLKFVFTLSGQEKAEREIMGV